MGEHLIFKILISLPTFCLFRCKKYIINTLPARGQLQNLTSNANFIITNLGNKKSFKSWFPASTEVFTLKVSVRIRLLVGACRRKSIRKCQTWDNMWLWPWLQVNVLCIDWHFCWRSECVHSVEDLNVACTSVEKYMHLLSNPQTKLCYMKAIYHSFPRNVMAQIFTVVLIVSLIGSIRSNWQLI